jgi:hypothetical protein
MILLPLGAFVVLQCRTDSAIQRNLRGDIETFYVAEAGLEHAVAEILPGQSLDHLLTGPDGVSGTSDDGVFPFAQGPPSHFPHAPFRYDVRVVPGQNGMIRVVSRGIGGDGAAKVLEALVTRAPRPFTPAALYAEADIANFDTGSAAFRVSGDDHEVTYPPEPAAAGTPSIPALGTARAGADLLLRRRLSRAAADQLSGAGGTPSVAATPRLDLHTAANSFASAPQAVSFPAITISEDGRWGTEAAPQLSVVRGDLDVRGRLTGSGALVVDGTLRITGTLEFSGIVLAMGAVLLDPSSNATVIGTLWQAASQDERCQLHGGGAIVYSSRALAGFDRVFPGILPRAVVVAGWQEQL